MSDVRDAWARWEAACSETTGEAVDAAIEHGGNAVFTLIHDNPARAGYQFWRPRYRFAVIHAQTVSGDVVIPNVYEATAWTSATCRDAVQRSIAAMVDDVDPAAVATVRLAATVGSAAGFITPVLAGAAVGLGITGRRPAAIVASLATAVGAAVIAEATRRYGIVAPFARPATEDAADAEFAGLWGAAMERLDDERATDDA